MKDLGLRVRLGNHNWKVSESKAECLVASLSWRRSWVSGRVSCGRGVVASAARAAGGVGGILLAYRHCHSCSADKTRGSGSMPVHAITIHSGVLTIPTIHYVILALLKYNCAPTV